jgi:hypothetical protein
MLKTNIFPHAHYTAQVTWRSSQSSSVVFELLCGLLSASCLQFCEKIPPRKQMVPKKPGKSYSNLPKPKGHIMCLI